LRRTTLSFAATRISDFGLGNWQEAGKSGPGKSERKKTLAHGY
jgi:hypothetical protein